MNVGVMTNNLGFWTICSVMVIVILVQGILHFCLGRAEAKKLQIPKEKVTHGIRAAVIIAIGPTISSVIVPLPLVVTIGGPMVWMCPNDVGAARTRMVIVSMVQAILPENSSDATTMTFATRGQAFNSVGWMIVTLMATSRMGWAAEKMNQKFSPVIVKVTMSNAAIGLFAYLVPNSLIGKPSPNWVVAVVAGVSILVINKVFSRMQRLQEFLLGIAMILGMVAATVVENVAGI